MSANNTMHIVLPLAGPESAPAAFPVARIMTRTFNARLRVLATAAQLSALQATLPSGVQETFAMESIDGDLVEATMREVEDARQSMVILAFRLPDKAPAGEMPQAESLGCRMLENLSCPILIVPPERDMSAWQLRRELLPQDGTPSCAAALAHIVRRNARMGIESLVLRVAGANVGQPTEPGSLPTPRYVDHPQYEWETWAQEFLERVYGTGYGASVNADLSGMRLLMASGEPAAEILRISEEKDVDLIVLPWHGILRSGRAGMVKGVLRKAACPVLLLPEHSERRKCPR